MQQKNYVYYEQDCFSTKRLRITKLSEHNPFDATQSRVQRRLLLKEESRRLEAEKQKRREQEERHKKDKKRN